MTEDRKIPQASLPGYVARDGRTIFVIGPFAWGKGANAAIAFREARKHFVARYTKAPYRFKVIDAPKDAWIDFMGDLHWADPEQEHKVLGFVEVQK